MSIKNDSDKTSSDGKGQLKLTEKQNNILKIIYAFIEDNGYSPTVREICGAANLSSSSTVQNHIKSLAKKGFISHIPKKSRAIRVVKEYNYKAKIEIRAKDLNTGNAKKITPGKYIMINKKKPNSRYEIEVID